MTTTKKIAIIGATSAMAEHCARIWVSAPSIQLFLVGRNQLKLSQISADLQVRNPQSDIQILTTDFHDPAAIQHIADQICDQAKLDIVLIAHGVLTEQATCQTDLKSCHDSLMTNAVSPVLFSEAFAGHLQKANHGSIAIIGSVAGDRGRKTNYIYGAAKGMLDRYTEGLRHRLYGSQVYVTLIKPGPTDTPMTAHLSQQGPKLASVEHVAQHILKGISKRALIVYAPSKWKLIMAVIRSLPNFIFNRLDI